MVRWNRCDFQASHSNMPAPAVGVPSKKLLRQPAFGKRHEFWRAFEQNEGGCARVLPRRGCEVRENADSEERQQSAASAASVPAAAAAAPPRRTRSFLDLPVLDRMPMVKRARRLTPISRTAVPVTGLGKREAGDRKMKQKQEMQVTSSPMRNLPMCLCCGGILHATSRMDPARKSRLLKCSKCGLISRVA